MKADLPLEERQRLAEASQRQIREAFVRRHVEVTADQRAIEKALNHSAAQAAQVLLAMRAKVTDSPTLTKPVVPATVAPPAPSADLRSALGLT